jgi:uncharacterized protein YndB with AHSA1/START domain
MTTDQEAPRVASASREIAADAGTIFELIADPAQQPRWDGNDNLAAAAAGQRVRRAGDVFTMRITTGSIRENHVVEFDEGRLIAWMPAEVGRKRPGHLWRWELEPLGASRTRVTHTYDARPVDHRKQAPGLAGPPRGSRRKLLTASSAPHVRGSQGPRPPVAAVLR